MNDSYEQTSSSVPVCVGLVIVSDFMRLRYYILRLRYTVA
jgi:hypothetical protein